MKKRPVEVLLVAGVAAVTLGWAAGNGLGSSLVYYATPSDLAHSKPGQRVRLGGYVEPGSLQVRGSTVSFVVTDGRTELRVVQTGSVPSLFREGRGVIVEGALDADRVFHSDTLIVKHDNNYRAPAPGARPEAVG